MGLIYGVIFCDFNPTMRSCHDIFLPQRLNSTRRPTSCTTPSPTRTTGPATACSAATLVYSSGCAAASQRTDGLVPVGEVASVREEGYAVW